MNINRVVITGNLTRDPELRSLPSGTAVCDLRVAVNTRRKDGEEWVDKPNFFDVTVFGGQGEAVAQHLTKGRGVAVDGRLEWRELETKDGDKRQAVDHRRLRAVPALRQRLHQRARSGAGRRRRRLQRGPRVLGLNGPRPNWGAGRSSHRKDTRMNQTTVFESLEGLRASERGCARYGR